MVYCVRALGLFRSVSPREVRRAPQDHLLHPGTQPEHPVAQHRRDHGHSAEGQDFEFQVGRDLGHHLAGLFPVVGIVTIEEQLAHGQVRNQRRLDAHLLQPPDKKAVGNLRKDAGTGRCAFWPVGPRSARLQRHPYLEGVCPPTPTRVQGTPSRASTPGRWPSSAGRSSARRARTRVVSADALRTAAARCTARPASFLAPLDDHDQGRQDEEDEQARKDHAAQDADDERHNEDQFIRAFVEQR